MWFDVVDYVEHAVGRGRIHDFQLFESVDSPWVVLEVYDRHSLFHWPHLVSRIQYMFRERRLPRWCGHNKHIEEQKAQDRETIHKNIQFT